jgi:serine/threonine-protein kinase
MEEHEPSDEEPVPIKLPKIGATLGSYRLVKLLGVGGMGRVYVAEHHRLGRKVALKLLLPEFSSNPDVVQRFFNEARAVNQINHPNIVEIVDFVEDPHGFNYFIMELLDGRDLRKTRDEDGPYLLGRTVAIGKQMASALAAAHGQGIVHRDIKPDNVVLIPREEKPNFIKLLDFGIAKLSSGVFQEKKTRLGMVLGTPGYMSPEQAFGRPIDGRSDIYSLGVLLHWMLVDKLPSAGNLPMKSAPKDEPPPDPLTKTARGQPIPPAMAQLVERCLRFDPDDRVQTMDRVREELSALAPTDIGESPATGKPPATQVYAPPAIPIGAAAAPALSLLGPDVAPPPADSTRLQPNASSAVPATAFEEPKPSAGELTGATRLKAPSSSDSPGSPEGEAATRIKLDSDRPAAGARADVATPDELAAFPPKKGGPIWIAVIAAVVVVGIGVVIVLRQGTPAHPPQPPPEIAVAPTVAPTAAPQANALPPPPEPSAAPPLPPVPTTPVPQPQTPPPPSEVQAAAPAPEAAPRESPKAKVTEHRKTGAKKKTKSGAADDTSILDPLAE